MKNFNGWIVLCFLLAFAVGVGCSAKTPNQLAPDQTVDTGKGDKLYAFPEHDHNEKVMD